MYSYYSVPSDRTAGLIHTLKSATHDLKLISSSFLAMKDQNAALTDFKPYGALTKRNIFPCSAPNSDPALIQCFSKFGADRNALCVSDLIISKLLGSATNYNICTESRETTLL